MPTSFTGLLVAALGGAAIGLEREWSGHTHGRPARFGGIRTFTMLGGIAGLAGWHAAGGQVATAAVLLGAAASLVVAGYVAASRADVDGTTEVSALVVLAAGATAGAGFIAVASAVVTLTTLLLVEKSRLHALVKAIDDTALRASARFAAMAVVILPLLPEGPFGPLDAIRPRELWMFVLFFSGLSFLGWIARRIVGLERGWVVAGLLGGVVSSTNVTLTFARTSRNQPDLALPLARGAVAACTVMLARVTVACAALNFPLSLVIAPKLALPFAIGLAILLAPMRGEPIEAAAAQPVQQSPLQLSGALQMAALFQLVLVALAVAQTWGGHALLTTSALIGLTDLDALTMSIARGAPVLSPELAATALIAGVVSNTLLKAAVAIAIGSGRFRWLVGGVLLAIAGASAWQL